MLHLFANPFLNLKINSIPTKDSTRIQHIKDYLSKFGLANLGQMACHQALTLSGQLKLKCGKGHDSWGYFKDQQMCNIKHSASCLNRNTNKRDWVMQCMVC